MDDATRILDSGTKDYPLDEALAAHAEPCPHCSTTINAGKLFCPSCGYQRGTWAAGTAAAKTEADTDRGPALFEIVDSSGNSYALAEGETVIGRGEVDIQVNDGYMSRRHAVFTAAPGDLKVSDLGSANGSFVGDLRLDRETPHTLEDGQAITLGRTEFTVRAIDAPAYSEADDDVISSVEEDYSDVPLEDAKQAGAERETAGETESAIPSGWHITNERLGNFVIEIGETTLGRSAAKSDLQVSGDGYISGLHGMLVASDDSLVYTDLGSTNGSLINGEPLEPNTEASLSVGDRLQLGQTEFTVSHGATPDEAEGNPDEPGIIAGM